MKYTIISSMLLTIHCTSFYNYGAIGCMEKSLHLKEWYDYKNFHMLQIVLIQMIHRPVIVNVLVINIFLNMEEVSMADARHVDITEPHNRLSSYKMHLNNIINIIKPNKNIKIQILE